MRQCLAVPPPPAPPPAPHTPSAQWRPTQDEEGAGFRLRGCPNAPVDAMFPEGGRGGGICRGCVGIWGKCGLCVFWGGGMFFGRLLVEVLSAVHLWPFDPGECSFCPSQGRRNVFASIVRPQEHSYPLQSNLVLCFKSFPEDGAACSRNIRVILWVSSTGCWSVLSACSYWSAGPRSGCDWL